MSLMITGGCGFVGSNLAAEALRQERMLTVVDNLSRTGARENLAWLQGIGEFEFVEADVRSAEMIATVVQRREPSAVFHLAGQVAMTTSIQDPRFDFETNALGTLNVLEAVRNHAPDSLVVYSSTNKVYGDLNEHRYDESKTRWSMPEYPDGLPEDLPLEFSSPYGCSKGAADQYMLDYHRVFGLKTVVLRHSSMYGGRQYATFDQGWIGWFCSQALHTLGNAAHDFTVSGNGKQVRDLLHADDLVRLYFAIAESPDAVAGQAFNIGGGVERSLSLLELLQWLSGHLNVDLNPKHIATRQSDQKYFVADNSKITRALNWNPQMGIEDGLSHMVNWVKSNVA